MCIIKNKSDKMDDNKNNKKKIKKEDFENAKMIIQNYIQENKDTK
jgi:hypothetical protein